MQNGIILGVVMLSVVVPSNFTEKKLNLQKNVYTIERWRSSQQTYNLFHIQDTHGTFLQGILTERKGLVNTAKLLLVLFSTNCTIILLRSATLQKKALVGLY